jgi:heme/copper-type cytochrome/quinol oxidase subunit 2
LAVGINCCTVLLALFLAFLACVAAGFARGDLAPGLARTPLTTHEILWTFAQVMGIATLAVLPSIVLLSLKKADAGLIAACAPLVIAVLILWFLIRRSRNQ